MKLAQMESEIMQEQSAHGQRMAVACVPLDVLAQTKEEIEQEQQQLQHKLHDAESRARVAIDSLTLLRLKVEESGHHKVHIANQASALLDSRAQLLQVGTDGFSTGFVF